MLSGEAVTPGEWGGGVWVGGAGCCCDQAHHQISVMPKLAAMTGVDSHVVLFLSIL